MAAPRDLESDAGRDRGLADTALAHGHDDASPVGLELGQKCGERRQERGARRDCSWSVVRRAFGLEQRSKRLDLHEPERQEGKLRARKAAQPRRHGFDGPSPALFHRDGNRIGRAARVEDPVEHEFLPADAELVEFPARALGLVERRAFGAGDQDERRLLAVGKRLARRIVECLLRLEARERAETRRSPDVALEKAGPRGGQREQAQRVPGGRGVEDDVVELRRHRLVSELFRELVERGDLDGAGSRQLLLDAAHRRVG
ncbi:MAG: hypothetical protein H6Q91_664 [Deltaproteobacteria bacterium]|nr:hypothetical protein [Deltaproteobacteria bacterium]